MGSLDRDVFLRVLKGAPLSVLLALWVFGPMDRKGINTKTGWSEGTIDKALLFLEDLGLVARPHYRKWALAEGFYQLPLPLAESTNFEVSGSYPQISETTKNVVSEKDGESFPQAETINFEVLVSESAKNGVSALSSSGSRSTTKNEVSPVLPCPEILKACSDVGIFGRKRTLLATLPHVVEAGSDFVRGHVKNAPTIELAIYRIEHNWRVSKSGNEYEQRIPKELQDVIRR